MSKKKFTFQYGQIYYFLRDTEITFRTIIYIPIWLDLLLDYNLNIYVLESNLHSNMVRFIMIYTTSQIIILILFTFQYGQIYYGSKSKLQIARMI